MTGSDADSEQELEASDSGPAESEKLVRFLTPVPRARTSQPPAEARSRAVAPAVESAEVGLFSERPIPRRNSSLLPPPGGAERDPPRSIAPPTHVAPEALDWGEAYALRSASQSAIRIDETPGANLAVDRGQPDEDDPDLAFAPPTNLSLRSLRGRRAIGLAFAGVAMMGVVVIALAARRSTDTPSIAAGSTAPASAKEHRGDSPEVPVPNAADPEAPVDPSSASELRSEARKLLEGGHAEDGVALARRAIAADPNEPESYVLLAAGLQDLGRWQESRDVFDKCVRDSNKRANAECVYFATRTK